MPQTMVHCRWTAATVVLEVSTLWSYLDLACGSSDASNQQIENGESGAGGGSKSPERSHGCEDEHVHGSETSGAAAALETMKAKYVALLEAKDQEVAALAHTHMLSLHG